MCRFQDHHALVTIFSFQKVIRLTKHLGFISKTNPTIVTKEEISVTLVLKKIRESSLSDLQGAV